jgi:hypothetical protein
MVVMRWLYLVLAGLVMVSTAGSYHGAQGQQQGPGARTTTPPVPASDAFINRYCLSCHNDRTKIAGLALNSVDVNNVSEDVELWEKVVRKLAARAMPPAGRPRPGEADYEAFVSHLETSLDASAMAKPNPGRTETFHRLNRNEYQNAIRDMLALEVSDVASLLPKDDESYGFDNVNVVALPPALIERYLSAAEKISQRAVGRLSAMPGPTNIELPADLTQETELAGMPLGTRGGTMVRHIFPLDGEYEVEIRLARDRDEILEGLTEPHEMELRLDGERLRLFKLQPPQRSGRNGDPGQGTFTVRIPVKAGPHEIGVAFLPKSTALLETERQPFRAAFNTFRHPRTQPALYRVSIGGPFDASGPGDTPSRQRILVCRPAASSEETACADRILSMLARRAYRRPVTDTDIHALRGFYNQGRMEGGFESGIQMALTALLVSPEFLFRVEADPPNVAPNTAYRLSDLELASRLSFFLWSSIPDDELLDTAIAGTLRRPDGLQKQVERMLADPRSQALVTNFAGQWFQLRNLAAVSPHPLSFPEFDDNLRQAFRRETELFFESVVKENRSVLDLLGANYTYLNERLAKHYGIPNVYGSRFRRVTLDKDSPRGGLLSQGSLLTVTSYPTRTAPTLRGKWILENILGTPPPAPPPNVPPFKEEQETGKVQTMRERMAEHRTNPACAGCHQLMDPIGFALDNYDAIGQWRDQEEGKAIDASGTLPSGAAFVGAAGLKQALISDPRPFLTTTTGKLLTYAVGRGVEYYDAPAIRKIVRDVRTQDYRFSALVVGVVNSEPFQMRRSKQ